MNRPYLYSEPVQGIKMIEPEVPHGYYDILLGYEVLEIEPDETCNFFVKPRPSRMNIGGWLLFGVTLIFLWPISAFACCIKTSYDTVQRPVYQRKELPDKVQDKYDH